MNYKRNVLMKSRFSFLATNAQTLHSAIIIASLLLILGRSSFAETPLRISPENAEGSGCDLVIANFDSVEEFTKFFQNLKAVAKANDVNAITDLIIYPLNTRVDGKKINFKNKSELLKKFKNVWTDTVAAALAAQETSKLFCNYQGVMIGNGQIWIKKLNNGKIGIGAINP